MTSHNSGCGLAMVQPYRRSGAAVAWLPWILALVLAAPLVASAQVASDDEGAPAAPLTRDRLGGDWCGFRDSLAQHGIRFDLWSTGFTQAMFQGTGDERGGTTLPLHSGGHFPIDSRDDLVATSLYASQRFGDSTRLMLGKINVIDLLARHPFFGGWGTDRFHSVAFVIPPNGITPPVIKGAVLTHSFAPYALTAMVFDPNDRSTSISINDLFEDGVAVSLGLWLPRRKCL